MPAPLSWCTKSTVPYPYPPRLFPAVRTGYVAAAETCARRRCSKQQAAEAPSPLPACRACFRWDGKGVRWGGFVEVGSAMQGHGRGLARAVPNKKRSGIVTKKKIFPIFHVSQKSWRLSFVRSLWFLKWFWKFPVNVYVRIPGNNNNKKVILCFENVDIL